MLKFMFPMLAVLVVGLSPIALSIKPDMPPGTCTASRSTDAPDVALVTHADKALESYAVNARTVLEDTSSAGFPVNAVAPEVATVDDLTYPRSNLKAKCLYAMRQRTSLNKASSLPSRFLPAIIHGSNSTGS